jgi:hypothetical protein
MAKTTFSHNVVVTPEFLNGFKEIHFDGQDLDHHYDPLGLSSLEVAGPDGLDSRYITLGTSQPSLSSSGALVSGKPIFGHKTFSGSVDFGYDFSVPGNPSNTVENSPKNFTGNQRYIEANGTDNPTIAQKFAALTPADIITKLMLAEQIQALEIDNGYYYSGEEPSCNNYSINGTSSVICPA